MKKQTKKTAKQTKVTNSKKAVAPAKAVASKPKLVLDPKRTAYGKKLIAQLHNADDLQGPGLIKQILQLYTAKVNPFSCAEIIAMGFNKSTVYRQTRAFNVLKQANAKKQLTSKGVAMLTGKNA